MILFKCMTAAFRWHLNLNSSDSVQPFDYLSYGQLCRQPIRGPDNLSYSAIKNDIGTRVKRRGAAHL